MNNILATLINNIKIILKTIAGRRIPGGGEIFNDYVNNQATAEYSSASGKNLIANAAAQRVIGKYNKPNSDAIFIIGNGTEESNRSNICEIFEDGVLYTGPVYKGESKDEDNILITKNDFNELFNNALDQILDKEY